MLKLVEQIKETMQVFAKCKTPPVLIGGLALVAHQVIRATQDIDFLVDSDDASALHDALIDLGYQCIYRSEDAANYQRSHERLDLLYAHRPIAKQFLKSADERMTSMGKLRVISAEGLIAFKLQGYLNDPSRVRDLDDIRSLLRAHWSTLNMDEVQRYFELFDREDLLNELKAEISKS